MNSEIFNYLLVKVKFIECQLERVQYENEYHKKVINESIDELKYRLEYIAKQCENKSIL
jgi:hypothetical protein